LKSTVPYNTALKGPGWSGRENLEEIELADSPIGTVFAHNILDPLPEPWAELIEKNAECVYSEIPWPAARDTFYLRSGLAPRPHGEYVAAVKAIVDRFRKPSYIVASKRDAFALADQPVRPIMHNGYQAWLAIAHAVQPTPDCVGTPELRAWLGQTYRSVYDFSCGYGAGLRPFEHFIGSDIDRKCLAYVARELL
jgi:hypothetical protein